MRVMALDVSKGKSYVVVFEATGVYSRQIEAF